MSLPKPAEIDAAVAEVLGGNRDAFRLIVRRGQLAAAELPRQSTAPQGRRGRPRPGSAPDGLPAGCASSVGERTSALVMRHRPAQAARTITATRPSEDALELSRAQVALAVQTELQAAQGDRRNHRDPAAIASPGCPRSSRRVPPRWPRRRTPRDAGRVPPTTVAAVYNLHYRANRLAARVRLQGNELMERGSARPVVGLARGKSEQNRHAPLLAAPRRGRRLPQGFRGRDPSWAC